MKNNKAYLLLFAVIFHFTSCQSGGQSASVKTSDKSKSIQRMTETGAYIQKEHFFENIPSASGIEASFPDSYYILGDDSPFLYRLDSNFKLVEQHPLFESNDFSTGRIPKELKPDLECLAKFTYQNGEYLLLLGSGSTDARYKGYVVNLNKQYEARELGLTDFYYFLRQVIQRNQQEELNLEGVAFDDRHVYVLQRAVSSGNNVMFRFEQDKFIRYLMEGDALPTASVFYFQLPQLAQYKAGFSGAYVFHDYLFYTASVESAPNAVEDGEVFGSYVGYVALNDLDLATNPANPLQATTLPLILGDGTPYKGKAESLVVNYVDKLSNYNMVVVSDDDLGHSELLEVQMKVK